ncbi:hypothetical protein [Umezawaea tangerina]|uniref:Pyridoxamine 5'-phosphate oxidase n=1 Tax=Umezawaea tangerina TaxID=84725 RepID=A0A2T0TMI2_9PSEU|nr:hypothetical protein [Umezawaea tangerina]PRY46821.1 hypothetical protein CLV43_1011102 [Umezawaea tangerina]
MEIAQAIDAALRKAAAVWVSVPRRRGRLVWALWRDGAVWVAVGGDQEVPGMVDGAEVVVTLRSPTTHSHLLDTPAVARLVEPDEETVAALRAAHLNGPAEWTEVYRLDLV